MHISRSPSFEQAASTNTPPPEKSLRSPRAVSFAGLSSKVTGSLPALSSAVILRASPRPHSAMSAPSPSFARSSASVPSLFTTFEVHFFVFGSRNDLVM